MKENIIKKKLAAGSTVIGTFVRMNSISVEALAYTGWDFVIIDAEHGVHTMEDISDMIRASKAAGISAVVRTPGFEPIHVMRSLDAGADGVQIPQVTTLEQIKQAVAAARYYPRGNRGACAFSAATCYSVIPFSEHIATSNQEVLVSVHIENVQTAEIIQDILEIDGIDVIFCGPWDLSQSLGIPGQTSDPRVTELIDRVIDICNKKNVPVGIFVRYPEEADKWLKKGIRYLTCNTDAGMYVDAVRSIGERLKKQIEQQSK